MWKWWKCDAFMAAWHSNMQLTRLKLYIHEILMRIWHHTDTPTHKMPNLNFLFIFFFFALAYLPLLVAYKVLLLVFMPRRLKACNSFFICTHIYTHLNSNLPQIVGTLGAISMPTTCHSYVCVYVCAFIAFVCVAITKLSIVCFSVCISKSIAT